ncbi:MAG: hypothetical protein ABJN04_05545 [Hyphomicrobiales bacterium]
MKSLNLKRTVAAFAFVFAGTTLSFAQTNVSVSLGNNGGVEPPPACAFPCQEPFVLPGFARVLALTNPDSIYETKLSRPAFRQQLEGWRKRAEVFRRTIELNQRKASDWKAANVMYLVEVGRYRQFVEAYRAAIALDDADAIDYGEGK